MKGASLHIAYVLPNLQVGGAERVAVTVINELVRRGHQVDLLLQCVKGDLLAELHPAVRVIDLKSARLVATIWPIRQYLRSTQPDAMIVNMWPLTVLAMVAMGLARLGGDVVTRMLLIEHTTWSIDEQTATRLGRWKVALTMRLAFRFAHAVAAVSRGAADDLARFAACSPASVEVIYNPVQQSGLSTSSSTEGLPLWWVEGTHRRVLAVGNLKPIKDYPCLIRAMHQLTKEVDARLLVLGEGGERAALQQQIALLGLEDRVLLLGSVQDPSPYYAKAELLVLSSKGEGFGNVLVEAMAHGVPVVSTDCHHGPGEILGHGQWGRLTPVGDADALSQAMAQTLSNPKPQRELRHRAGEFSVDRAVDAYLVLASASYQRAK